MKPYPEEVLLPVSGLQHFRFCPRQWALIHLEMQWTENRLTAEGRLVHERAHDPGRDEKRGDLIIARGLPVFSYALGVRGVCDVVEFRRDEEGVPLDGREGRWLPTPVEYKHGSGHAKEADALQLCCQGMCLEDMLCCGVPGGYLYYAATRRREFVAFTEEARRTVKQSAQDMHALYARGRTPRVKPHAGCKSCSLRDSCLPQLGKAPSASGYIARILEEESGGGS